MRLVRDLRGVSLWGENPLLNIRGGRIFKRKSALVHFCFGGTPLGAALPRNTYPKQKCNFTNHGGAVDVIRSLSTVWNHHKVMYGINPKERYTLCVMPYACGDYILAHARLHTNPSDWIEKSKSFDLLFSWSGLRGSNPPPPPWQGGALPNELNPRIWCLRSESNQRHEDFQSSALPTELQRRFENGDSDGARTHDL